ncbi:GNAT family N-acetyltransferase [Agromyces mangrovi Wang et al. 2018]|uniref:GNAT family N-acetyltransferase n=1 Tax=Agromyces mangrovi TaxID=1858653 RepID=UPI00257450BF|nr:GNAT family N-acetyltransferase [Agromyces mangrovi]BDZ63280.1 N-acetyltransferase GCN5 [Agromyces mangrovi]
MYLRPRPIGDDDALDGFDCGEPSLDDWLARVARRNERNGSSRTFVSCVAGEQRIAGYYAVSTHALVHHRTPSRLRRNTPDPIPVILLGRLAVDSRDQGRGLGASLLQDAMLRCVAAADSVGARAIVVDAIDDAAVSFTERWGFVLMPDSRRCLYVLMKDIRATVAELR